MIFDTHAHYTASQFDSHRQLLLSGLPAQGVCAVVDCATDYDSACASLALGELYPWLYTAVGIHPESITDDRASTVIKFGGDWRKELAAMEPLYANPHVVAVGECGLDYHWEIPREEQIALFEAELEIAKTQKLPIIIHDREAHSDTYALLKKHRPRGVVHCYSGSAEDARWLTAQGMYIGFGGVVTFKNARKVVEAVAATPIESILLETDCPYMAPEPFRGKENNSALISYVAAKIAEIKNLTEQQVLEITEQNARTLFNKQ